MNRREFIKLSGAAGISVIPAFRVKLNITLLPENAFYAGYRDFNLTEKTSGRELRKRFNEQIFQIMKEWGFNFARIPMSYRNWSLVDDRFTIGNPEFLIVFGL